MAAGLTAALVVAAVVMQVLAWQAAEEVKALQAQLAALQQAQKEEARARTRENEASRPAPDPELEAIQRFPWDAVLRRLEGSAGMGVRVRSFRASAANGQARIEVVYRKREQFIAYLDQLNQAGDEPKWLVEEVQWGNPEGAELTATLTFLWPPLPAASGAAP